MTEIIIKFKFVFRRATEILMNRRYELAKMRTNMKK